MRVARKHLNVVLTREDQGTVGTEEDKVRHRDTRATSELMLEVSVETSSAHFRKLHVQRRCYSAA